MPGGDDTVSDETVDSVHKVEQKVKDTNGVVITQPTLDGLDAIVVPSAENLTTTKGLLAVNPAALKAPPS